MAKTKRSKGKKSRVDKGEGAKKRPARKSVRKEKAKDAASASVCRDRHSRSFSAVSLNQRQKPGLARAAADLHDAFVKAHKLLMVAGIFDAKDNLQYLNIVLASVDFKP